MRRGRGVEVSTTCWGPPLLDGITTLTVDSLLSASLLQFLCLFSIAIPFSFRLLWSAFLQAFGVRFPLSGSSTLTVLRVP
jgi:hypothetical protein